jgi:hypothetical protein
VTVGNEGLLDRRCGRGLAPRRASASNRVEANHAQLKWRLPPRSRTTTGLRILASDRAIRPDLRWGGNEIASHG